MSCCCFDRHGHPSSTACLFSYRSGSGRNVFIVGLDASLCLWYVQAAQLRGTCVQCSTVAPVCLCVFLVRFNFVCPLKHSKSTQAQAFCCLTRAQRGGKCKCMCTHLVLISSPPPPLLLEALGGIHHLCDGLSACVTFKGHLSVTAEQLCRSM